MSSDPSPGGVTPPSDPAPASKKTLMSQIDWKHVALGVVTVLGALGYTGVIPPAVEHNPAQASLVCPSDPAFQADVRAALAKLTDAQSDMRERMARVESALSQTSR